MSLEAGGQAQVAAADQHILATLERRDFRGAAEQLSSLVQVFPDLEPVAEELYPALDALHRGAPAEAFFRLSQETRYDSRTEDRLLEITAEDLERTNHELLAAAAWWATRDLRGRQKATQILGRLGIDTTVLQGRVRKLAIEHYRKRIQADPDDARAWEQLAKNQLDSGDTNGAYESGTRATTLDVTRAEAAGVVARILASEGRTEEATAWIESNMTANPGEAWPWLLLAELRAPIAIESAIQAANRALELAPTHSDALALQRRLLRQDQRWPELADLLEQMIGQTLKMSELSELHAELGELLVKRLNHPIEGLAATQRSDWFRDRPAVLAWYWQSLAEGQDDPAVWEEVEEFFYVNELWTELARLLVKKAEHCSNEDLLPVMDELALVYAMEPAGTESLFYVLRTQISRARDPQLRAQLEQRLQNAEQRPIARSPTPSAPKNTVGVLLAVIAACGIVGAVVAALLITLTWGLG